MTSFGMYLLFPILGLSFIVSSVRLWRGPTLADRIVALEVLAFLVLAILITFGTIFHQPYYVDIGLVVAMVTFVATVAFARFMEKGEQNDHLS
jgi:multicomponent Na+:H+ antiporter subunit F